MEGRKYLSDLENRHLLAAMVESGLLENAFCVMEVARKFNAEVGELSKRKKHYLDEDKWSIRG